MNGLRLPDIIGDDTRLDATPSGRPTAKSNAPNRVLLQTPANADSGGAQKEFSPLLYTVNKNNAHRNAIPPRETMSSARSTRPSAIVFDESDSMESFDRQSSNATSMLNSTRKHRAGSKFKENVLVDSNQGSIPLKEQEDVINYQKNMIFDLQLKIHMLEQCTPENVQTVVRENGDLKSQLAQLQQKYDALKDRPRHSSPSRDTAKLESTISGLQLQMSRLQQELQNKDSRIDSLEHERQELLSEKTSAGDNEHLRDRVEELESANRRLELRNESLESDNNNLQSQSQDASDMNTRVISLERELDDAHLQISGLNDTIATLKSTKKGTSPSKILGLEEELQSLRRTIASKNNALSDAKSEQERLSGELIAARADVSSAQGELKTVNVLMDRCRSDLDNCKKERDYFEQRLHDAQKRIDTLGQQANQSVLERVSADEARDLKGKLADKENEINKISTEWKAEKAYLQEKIASLERMRSNYEEQQANLLKDKSTIKETIEIEKKKHEQEWQSLDIEVRQLQSQVTSLKATNELLTSQLQTQEQHVKKLETTLLDREDDIIVSQEQLIATEDSKAQLEAKLQQLQSSTETLENTLNALREVNDNERQGRVEMETQLREAEREVERLSKERAEVNRDHGDVENKYEKLRAKHDKTCEELEHAQDVVSKLKAKLARVDTHNTSTVSAASKYKQKCKEFVREIQRLQDQERSLVSELNKYKEKVLVLREQQLNQMEKKPAKASPAEVRGLVEQIKHFKDVAKREYAYRADLMFMKHFFMLQIRSYQACNSADLTILRAIGIYPELPSLSGKRPRLQSVAYAVLASIRIRRRHDERVDHEDAAAAASEVRSQWRRTRQVTQ